MSSLSKRKGTLTIVTGGQTPMRHVVKGEMSDLAWSGGKTIEEAFARGRRDENDVVTYITGNDPTYTGQLTVWVRADKLESADRAPWLATQAILRGGYKYLDPTNNQEVVMTPTGGTYSAPRWTLELKYDLSDVVGSSKDVLITLKNVDFGQVTETGGDLYQIQSNFNVRAEPVISYPTRP